MYCIQETDKLNSFFKIFNIIKLEGNKILLPIDKKEISIKKAEILAKKTKKILDKSNSNKVILSKLIKQQQNYINYLYTYNFEIIDGKWLFEALAKESLEYVTTKMKIKKQDIQIAILINEVRNNIFENIKQIVRQYKRVNIITNHIEKFKKIEEEILKKEGIMISVSNNKKKSLTRAKVILNVDFPTELIDKYNINEEAIIINLCGNVKINKKRFNGININDYEITYENVDKFDQINSKLYDKKDIYEANLYKNQPFKYVQEKIKKDNLKIVELVGNNTII